MEFSEGSVKQNVFASIYTKTHKNIVNNGKKKMKTKVGRFGASTNEN